MICDQKNEAVTFCHDAVTKEEALYKVIELACSALEISTPDKITALIMERDNKLIPGIDQEVVVPHCRSDSMQTRISAALFIPSGIEYNSVDCLRFFRGFSRFQCSRAYRLSFIDISGGI